MHGTTVQFGLISLLLGQSAVLARIHDRTDLKPAGNGDEKRLYDPDAMVDDPGVLFETLVHRYRTLASYRDTTQLVQITRREGHDEIRTETRLECLVKEGEFEVRTPQQQVRQGLSLDLPFRKSEALRQMERRHKLWLAPHLTFRFADDPLRQFRDGFEHGFTPLVAERIIYNEQPMLHLELHSGDGISGLYQAKYDLYVNPESMMIEHIRGYEQLPDGAEFITTLDIRPMLDPVDRRSTITG